jgi:predicted nucleic acid-binding Zn ribbon protein
MMSLNSFHLKGSGWYVTDYAGRKSGSQPEKKSSESSVKEDKGSKSKKKEASKKSSSES